MKRDLELLGIVTSLVTLLSVSQETLAACPGSSSYATVIGVQAAAGGAYYLSLDVTPNPSAIDNCSCRQSGSNTLYLFRTENPATDATKAMVAMAMLAKATNKQLGYYTTGCYNGTPGSGYAIFSQIWTQ